MKIITHIGKNNGIWSPWYGCFQISEACKNCYIKSLNNFENKFYTMPDQCLTKDLVAVGLFTDFFLPQADCFRDYAWEVMRNNPSIIFEIYTKRVEKIMECVPNDWGEGYENVIICLTTENQRRADERIPIFLKQVKCKHKWLNCAPMLENIDMRDYLSRGIEAITCSGERGISARVLKQEWVENLSQQCKKNNTHFEVMFLGSNFLDLDNKLIIDKGACFKSSLANNLQLNNYVPIQFNI